MSRYLNPKSDLVFKKIFGEHPDLLKSFLNALLPLSSDRFVEEISYLPTEHIPEIPGFKYTVVDVRCRDNHGRYFIVEMQLNWSVHFLPRMIFNTAATYVKQLKRGENYNTLCPVYGLSIVSDTFTKGSEWFHHYQLTHTQDTSNKLEDIQLIFLELPKFKPTTFTEKKLAVLWMRYMTEINEKTEEVDTLLLENLDIKKALDLTEIAAYTPDELRTYEANWDAISTEKTLMSDKYDQGREEGRDEEKHEIARNLLLKGLDGTLISDSTGLSVAQIEKIKATTT